MGSPPNHSNCLHVLGPTFLVSATLEDFLMSHFVTPSGRVNGGESNVATERGGGGGRGVAVGVSAAARAWPVGSSDASGDITPPASGHRLHSVAECGRAKDARAPLPALTLCAPAAEHHPGRGASTRARSTACCLSTACGAATCQLPFPLPTCTCGPLGNVHFFPLTI